VSDDDFASNDDFDPEDDDGPEDDSEDPPDEPPVDASDGPPSEESDVPGEPPEDDRDAFVLPAAPPRSFFAQPEPLKWIVGGANSLRIVPAWPHEGQNWGPGSFRPWRMSVR
jgi:hypothetical protein